MLGKTIYMFCIYYGRLWNFKNETLYHIPSSCMVIMVHAVKGRQHSAHIRCLNRRDGVWGRLSTSKVTNLDASITDELDSAVQLRSRPWIFSYLPHWLHHNFTIDYTIITCYLFNTLKMWEWPGDEASAKVTLKTWEWPGDEAKRNVDRTSDRLVTKGCGQIDTVPVYHRESSWKLPSLAWLMSSSSEANKRSSSSYLRNKLIGYVSEWLRSKLYRGIINARSTTPPIASELLVFRSPAALLAIDQVYGALT
jgi:hypothetical protein